MGFLERAIKRGIGNAVEKAVGNAVQKKVEPKATELANKAANSIDQAARNTERQAERSSGLEGAVANLERSMQDYATKAATNMKICPKCEKPTTADKKFCPDCGAKLPEQTVAQGAVCTGCGKQNSIGTKFCDACGAKLPAAIAEEQAQADRNAAVIAEWDTKLPQYPKWNCGGKNYCIEDMDGYIRFSADFEGNRFAAEQAVAQYRKALVQNGFIQAGQYPNIAHLYKRVNGVCYHADTEHCFEGDPDCPNIYFNIDEPTGGYDYVKPEPKKQVGLKDLFKF